MLVGLVVSLCLYVSVGPNQPKIFSLAFVKFYEQNFSKMIWLHLANGYTYANAICEHLANTSNDKKLLHYHFTRKLNALSRSQDMKITQIK